MVNDYQTVFNYQAFITKYLHVIDLILHGLLFIQEQPLEVLIKKSFLKISQETSIQEIIKKRFQHRSFPVKNAKFERVAIFKNTCHLSLVSGCISSMTICEVYNDLSVYNDLFFMKTAYNGVLYKSFSRPTIIVCFL